MADTDFPTTIRRTAVVKLELAPGAGGKARLWLHPQGVGLVDVTSPPDAVLEGLTLTGVDTIRLGGTSYASYATVRFGPSAAEVDTLPQSPAAAFAFSATDDFAGTPGPLQGRNTGQGWPAPWGRTPACQSTPSVFQMMVSSGGTLHAETPSMDVVSNRFLAAKVPGAADANLIAACSATTFRSLPAVFPDKGSVLLTVETLLDGDLDHLTVGLMAGSCLAAIITRDRRAGDKNWVLLDPVYRLRPWLDAGNTGSAGRVASGTGPAGWHTVAVRLNPGPDNSGTTSIWTREGRGPVDTAAPPRGTLTGCRLRGVDALMISTGGTAQVDNLAIRSLP